MNILQCGEQKWFICDNDNISKNHILWEITSLCNQSCSYCYPSRTNHSDIEKDILYSIVNQLNNSAITNIHITGGEPILNTYFFEIIQSLKEKMLHLTTNLTLFPLDLKNLLLENRFYSIAVSLDSLCDECNDFLRGNTQIVKKNLESLLNFRKTHQLPVKIRIHCVITKYNLPYIPQLLYWAKENGIDEVSCQPVFIDGSHPLYNKLGLTQSELLDANKIFTLEQNLFKSNYASSHKKLLQELLTNHEILLFANTHLCMPYIDAKGNIWSCPRKNRTLSNLQTYNCIVNVQCFTSLKHFKFNKII